MCYVVVILLGVGILRKGFYCVLFSNEEFRKDFGVGYFNVNRFLVVFL